MGEIADLLGRDSISYKTKYEDLVTKIHKFFWDTEKGAYVDSFTTGKRHVTRHANIFAVMFQIADETQRAQIIQNVIQNTEIPAITTPYFKFFELEVLCQEGYLQDVLQIMRDYWGGMLERGAVTFWEEFDPRQPEEAQYDMYGDRFGKSLCHAWSASPIYFLAKYYVGLQPLPGGDAFLLEPHMEFFSKMDCTLPVGKDLVHIRWENNMLTVETDCSGGILKIGEHEMEIKGPQFCTCL